MLCMELPTCMDKQGKSQPKNYHIIIYDNPETPAQTYSSENQHDSRPVKPSPR